MRVLIAPFFVYLIMISISLMIPASEGYDTVMWKFIIGHIYAVPSFLVAFIVTKKITERKK